MRVAPAQSGVCRCPRGERIAFSEYACLVQSEGLHFRGKSQSRRRRRRGKGPRRTRRIAQRRPTAAAGAAADGVRSKTIQPQPVLALARAAIRERGRGMIGGFFARRVVRVCRSARRPAVRPRCSSAGAQGLRGSDLLHQKSVAMEWVSRARCRDDRKFPGCPARQETSTITRETELLGKCLRSVRLALYPSVRPVGHFPPDSGPFVRSSDRHAGYASATDGDPGIEGARRRRARDDLREAARSI